MHRTSALVALSLSLVAVVASVGPALAQQEAAAEAAIPAANPADVESIDAIIAALYDVISGPAGERDWDRFRSLFAPNGTLSPMAPRPDGSTPVTVISPEQYVQWGGAYFLENAFYEREAGRELQQFGNVANAMSFYESRPRPGRGALHAGSEHDHAPPRRYALVRSLDRLGRSSGGTPRARLRRLKPPRR